MDNISCKVHPKSQVQVIYGTVGEFLTDYIAKNGRIIQIIRQIPINYSVQFLGVPDNGGGSGFPFICNLQAPVEDTGWESANNCNQDWGGIMFGAYNMTHVTWGASVDASPANSPQIPVKPHASVRHVHDKLLCHRHQ